MSNPRPEPADSTEKRVKKIDGEFAHKLSKLIETMSHWCTNNRITLPDRG
jgi:hypothetical protein